MTTSTPAPPLDAETLDEWQREHERVIADSQPGSYSEHVSRQMLMALDAARAGLAATVVRDAAAELVKAAERIRNYGETLSYECFECGGENEYWGIDIGDRNTLAHAERKLAAALRDTDGATE